MTIPAIEAKNVTVRFRPYLESTPTMRRSVLSWRRRTVDDVVAINDLSFQVMPGEAFGVIGRNGAGKSTLMRVMAGTLRPNEGTVTINGRASTLLQLGVGFNNELSGRRNVYLGGLAGGMRKADIDEQFDSIVEYAELTDAIDRPLKTYSSGMFSRLAFSVGMALDPDILLLDEVLAVGDESFREKSLSTMRDLLDRAGTIVFVSHALANLAEFCDRAMWLERGAKQMVGDAEEVVAAYKTRVHEDRAAALRAEKAARSLAQREAKAREVEAKRAEKAREVEAKKAEKARRVEAIKAERARKAQLAEAKRADNTDQTGDPTKTQQS